MGEELKQTYTIRIPKQIASSIEAAAQSHGITPTTLIQSVITRKFRSRESADPETDIAAQTALPAKLETLRKSIELTESNERTRFHQLRFEIAKTRAALLHSLDQTLGATAVDRIIEASEQTAREYMTGVEPPPEKNHETQLR